MRHGTTGRRSRGRGNSGRRGNQPRAQVFDSNGPDVRIRGTAFQVLEKYMNLAKDAASGGDRILTESYLQHAEHYQRLINSWNEADQEIASDSVQTYGEEDSFAFENRARPHVQEKAQTQNAGELEDA